MSCRLHSVEKPPAYLKNGVAGAEPPTGTRGGSPGKIPLSGGKGARGIGIVSQKFISKTDFFYGLTAVKKSRR